MPFTPKPFVNLIVVIYLDIHIIQNPKMPAMQNRKIPQQNIPEDKHHWTANRILLPEQTTGGEIGAAFTEHTPESGGVARWLDTLSSHFMTPETVRMLAEGDVNRFLVVRRELIRSHLQTFLDRMCEWDFEDTPPLETLIMDDVDEDDEDDE